MERYTVEQAKGLRASMSDDNFFFSSLGEDDVASGEQNSISDEVQN